MKNQLCSKHTILTLMFAVVFVFSATRTNAQTCVPAPIGLSSWYAGENSPLDARGGNHGTPQNGASYAAGQVGRAFNFDGTNDYYSAPSDPAINFGTGDFSVEYWIKINGAQLSAGREYGVVNKNVTYQGNPGWGFELSTEFGNFPNPRIDFFNTISIWNSTNVRATITTDVWHHVVGLRENGVNKLYLDGVLAQTNANTNAAANVDNNQPLQIGSWLGTYFPGQLDEISLYKRALSPAEIQSIFNAGTAGKCPTAAPASVGLAEWWTADGNALGVRNRNNGALQNGASYANGKVGQAFSFDGINDALNVPDSPHLNPVSQITVEAWVFPTADSGSPDSAGVILTKEQIVAGVGGIVQYALSRRNAVPCGSGAGIPSGNFQFYLDGVAANGCDGWIDGNAPLPVSVWTHIAVTYDGSFVRAYVNGIQTRAFGETGAISVTTGDLRIGARDADLTQGFFAGRVDEPAIYDRALSASEIQAIFNAGSAGKSKPTATVAPINQVLWLAGDGNATDLSGNGNNGTLQGILGGTTFEIGKVGQSFALRNPYSYIVVPDAPSLEVSNQLTLEAWIKSPYTNSYHQIISKFGTSGNWAYQMGISVNRSLRLDVSQLGGPDYEFVVSPPDAIGADVWTHVAATFNNGAVTLYVNGAPVANQNVTFNTIYSGGNSNVAIGRDAGGDQYFPGQIDEPAIYNRALSANEIASIYNAGQAGKLKQTTTSGATATVGDVTLTFPNAATRTVQQIPLDETDFPALPNGMTSTGLVYDIATDVLLGGATDLCFNLPSFASLSLMEFEERRILHLENGEWTNRTLSRDFATKTICARASSLSPFAIVDSNIAPTAANVSISGRITNAFGNGIANVRVSITGENGNVRNVSTNSFGYYRFDEIFAGQTYVLTVSSKCYEFSPPTQIVYASNDLTEINFAAIE